MPGKTANYTGLICNTADAGFGITIVLAGIHNNPSSQTQNKNWRKLFRIRYATLTRALDQRSIQIGDGDPYFGIPNVAHSLTSSIEKGDPTGASVALVP